MKLFKHKFRQVKKLPDWFYILPALLMRLYRMTMRVEIDDRVGFLEHEELCVGVIWHNRLLMLPLAVPKHLMKNSTAVVSASRDGQYLVDLLKQFGTQAIRGSSSRKGHQVLHAGVNALKDGRYVVFTPDGPRGPIYEMRPGPVHLASITGTPVMTVAVNYSSYWQLKSWDRFQIPKPFCRISLVLGELFQVPPDLSGEQLEEWRLKIQNALSEISIDRD